MQRILTSTAAVLDVVDGRAWDEAPPCAGASPTPRTSPSISAQGPLFRTTMFEADDGRSVVLLLAHHLVADYASIAIVIRDLDRLYAVGGDLRRAGFRRRPIPSPPSRSGALRSSARTARL